MRILQIVHIKAGHDLGRSPGLQILQCTLQVLQRVHTGNRNNGKPRDVVDHICFEGPFCQQHCLCRFTFQMGPPLSLAAILLANAGDPSKLTLFDIVKPDL